MKANNETETYIYQAGAAEIKYGTITRCDSVTISVNDISVERSGYISIKADLSKYKTLNIDTQFATTVSATFTIGYGTSQRTFAESYTVGKTRETKVFDITDVSGEVYINCIHGGYTSTAGQLFNIWLEV